MFNIRLTGFIQFRGLESCKGASRIPVQAALGGELFTTYERLKLYGRRPRHVLFPWQAVSRMPASTWPVSPKRSLTCTRRT